MTVQGLPEPSSLRGSKLGTSTMPICAYLFGISVKNLSRIQRIQNTLARVITCSKSRSSSAPLLKHLHWLPVSAHIHFKIALLTFKSLHTIAKSSVIPHSTLCSFPRAPLFQCLSILCPTCQYCIRLDCIRPLAF